MNILVTGDFCPQLRLQALILDGRDADVYNDFAEVLAGNDLAITNLECPLVVDGEPIAKVGRHLKASPACVRALQYGGFNLLTLANNHIMDYGAPALSRTIELCRNHGIACVGAGPSLQEAERPYFHNTHGLRVAVLSFAENEFSIAGPASAGANPLNPVRNYARIREAAQEADFVFVIVHGGHEHYSFPSQRMVDTYRFFIEAGANIVIGHHAHCYSGFEAFRHGHIFYGLGNFLFDSERRRDAKWNHGFAVRFSLAAGKPVTYSLFPYVQGNREAGVRLLAGDSLARFHADVQAINAVIQDPEALSQKWEEFVRRHVSGITRYLLPLNTYLNDLYLRLRLPFPFTRQRTLRLLNMARCESHHDTLVGVLKRRLQ